MSKTKRKKRRLGKCYSGIGGQAVLEGIMMKNNDRYSVAVRRPDGSIAVDVESCHEAWAKYKITKFPFIRGVFNFVNSLTLGIRSLNYSAEIYGEEETAKSGEESSDASSKDSSKGKSKDYSGTLTGILAVIIAVGLFMVLPVYITKWITADIRNDSLIAIIEGGIRLGIFLLYVIAISLMKDIRRVYMYHGAEHKCINCIERGRPLNVKNVKRSSRMHKRCGTSFLLFVVVVSIIVFFFIRVDNMALKVLLRIALIPVIAGISYEILRLAGRYDNFLTSILSAPGLLLQSLTTREPDDDMIEVAICAVEAVFDWRKFQTEQFGYDRDESSVPDPADIIAEDLGEDYAGEISEIADRLESEIKSHTGEISVAAVAAAADAVMPETGYVAEAMPETEYVAEEVVEVVEEIPAETVDAVTEEVFETTEAAAQEVVETAEEIQETTVETVEEISAEPESETPAEETDLSTEEAPAETPETPAETPETPAETSETPVEASETPEGESDEASGENAQTTGGEGSDGENANQKGANPKSSSKRKRHRRRRKH